MAAWRVVCWVESSVERLDERMVSWLGAEKVAKWVVSRVDKLVVMMVAL